MEKSRKYRRTYSDLRMFAEQIKRPIKPHSPQSKLIKELLSGTDSTHAATQALLGFGFLGITWSEGILEFRSNRYFLDSLKLLNMPSKEELETTYNRIEKTAISAGYSINELFNQFIGEVFHTIKVADTPEIFSSHQMPILSPDDLSFLDENGYLVVENAIPLDLCDELANRLKSLASFERGTEKGGYLYGSGSMQRVYNLLGKDAIFRDLLLHPVCDLVMEHMFSRATYHEKYYLTSFHGNILFPGAESQIWHVDANVPDPLPPWIIRSNSNYIIQDFTEENGATEVVPGSHKLLRKPTKTEAEKLDGLKTIQMCAPKGSIVFWHGHLWHRSGANRTSVNRSALLAAYSASFFREVCMEENPYLHFNASTADRLSPRLKTILGWNHGVKDYC